MREPLMICAGFLVLGALLHLGFVYLPPLSWAVVFSILGLLALIAAGCVTWLYRRISQAIQSMQAFH